MGIPPAPAQTVTPTRLIGYARVSTVDQNLALQRDALTEAFRGCDAVVLMASKGESEGGLYRSTGDPEHVIPEEYRDRVIVIRPRHRLPLGFVERRWEKLAPIADLGALRAREVLLGERHAQCDLAARGRAPSYYTTKLLRLFRSASR